MKGFNIFPSNLFQYDSSGSVENFLKQHLDHHVGIQNIKDINEQVSE